MSLFLQMVHFSLKDSISPQVFFFLLRDPKGWI